MTADRDRFLKFMTEGKGRETPQGFRHRRKIFWGNRSTSLTTSAEAVKSVTLLFWWHIFLRRMVPQKNEVCVTIFIHGGGTKIF